MSHLRFSFPDLQPARRMLFLVLPAILLLLLPGSAHSVQFENLCDSTDTFGGFHLPFVLWDWGSGDATFTLEPGGRVIAGFNPDGAHGDQSHCDIVEVSMTLKRSGEVVASGAGAILYPAPEGGDFELIFEMSEFDCEGDPYYVVLSGDLNGCPITTGIESAPDHARSDWGSIKQLFR
jgi:hypothetical protein